MKSLARLRGCRIKGLTREHRKVLEILRNKYKRTVYKYAREALKLLNAYLIFFIFLEKE